MASSFQEKSVTLAGKSHRYQIYVPDGYRSGMPAILFLHGAGESGRNNLAQLKIGLPPAVLAHPEKWPFLVIAPQKPSSRYLWPSYRPKLNAILEAVEKEYAPDPLRRYITGLSQGGNGTFVLATKLAWKFAAAAPICGWADPMASAKLLKTTPLWVFHGGKDEIVPPSCSEAVLDVLKRWKANTKLTMYPKDGHDSWTSAYKEPLGEWFLSHTLAAQP